MLIAGIGIPSCGKSTVMRRLAEEISAESFHEPEEDEWPDVIRERKRYGFFNCVHAFRALRIPGLMKAAEISRSGGTAVVDSYYDKLCSLWLGRPGTEWLIDPEDPYFSNFLDTARLDFELLPDADVLVVFGVAEDAWRKSVVSRGRKLDAESDLLASFEMNGYFSEAADFYASKRTGLTRVVRIVNTFVGVEVVVTDLKDRLKEIGAIS